MHFILSVGLFFAPPGEKRLAKEEKYHAAVRPERVEGQARIAFV
jgi:hypothetical protein